MYLWHLAEVEGIRGSFVFNLLYSTTSHMHAFTISELHDNKMQILEEMLC